MGKGRNSIKSPRTACDRRQSGQVSILLGMMMLTFILFFAFVVNVGMLVNAKINLQNAADLAAYAGAAVQARQLNHISYLNYEMRRQYKKFLYRYYVIGNMSQKSHPGTAGAPTTGNRVWSPDGNPGSVNYGVPAVCLNFKADENFCQVATLPSISMPPVTPLDAVNSVLINQLQAIEAIRKNNCKRIGVTNTQLLGYWLFNTDPDLQYVQTALASSANSVEDTQVLNTLKTLGAGLGLIPRELILRSRIQTLNEYVNHKAEKVNRETANQMKQEADWAKRERSLQAFESAYHTLGSGTFDNTDSIEMEELLPSASDGSALLHLRDIKARFDSYAVDMEVGGTGCLPRLVPVITRADVPLGVYKDGKTLTYYAIKLQAKAKVMFSPFGDINLKAYAAAQPFGSRIGPAWDGKTAFTQQKAANPQFPTPSCLLAGCEGAIPWLPVMESATGWDTNKVIYGMYTGFAGTTGSIPPSIGYSDMLKAYQVGMVPNPVESGFYNIPGDLPEGPVGDPFQKFFDEQGKYAFWAPIWSADKTGAGATAEDAIREMITDLMPPASSGSGPSAALQSLMTALQSSLGQYVTKLKQGAGEDGEGFNVVRLTDPFHTLQAIPGSTSGQGDKKLITFAGSGDIFLSDSRKVKTSWNEVNDRDFEKLGRTGYSVKFVPFKTLLHPSGVSTDGGGGSWTNIPHGDSDFEQDGEKLSH